MTASTPFEDRQHDLNPHRDEEQQRVADMAWSQLNQRGVHVSGDEDSAELARLLDAVEHFEQAVSALGASRMSNAPDSTRPDDPKLVLPARHDDEALGPYAARVREAAEGLLGLMRNPPADLRGVGDAALGGLAM